MGAGAETSITITKKQRKFSKELQTRLLKREESENKKKLRSKLRNEKKRTKRVKENPPKSAAPPPPPVETGNKDTTDKDDPKGFRYLRAKLISKQKPGVSFPYDSYSCKELSPDPEAIAMAQYNLKRGLKDFGKDGILELGK
jgi:hypothetical protein